MMQVLQVSQCQDRGGEVVSHTEQKCQFGANVDGNIIPLMLVSVHTTATKLLVMLHITNVPEIKCITYQNDQIG